MPRTKPADASRLHGQLAPCMLPEQLPVVRRGTHLVEREELHAAVEAAPAQRAHLLVRRALLLPGASAAGSVLGTHAASGWHAAAHGWMGGWHGWADVGWARLGQADELRCVEAAEEVPEAAQAREDKKVGVEHDDARHSARQHEVEQRLVQIQPAGAGRGGAQGRVHRPGRSRDVDHRLQADPLHREPPPHGARSHLCLERRRRLIHEHVVAHVVGCVRLDVPDDAHRVVHLSGLAHRKKTDFDHLEEWPSRCDAQVSPRVSLSQLSSAALPTLPLPLPALARCFASLRHRSRHKFLPGRGAICGR